MKNGKFEAEDIYLLLYERFEDGRQWVCAREVGEGTGGWCRRLDFVAANCYASEWFGVHAFEVKVSKSDLRRELTEPDKHNVFFDSVDTYSIVAPDYVLDKEYVALIPPKWGIYKAIAGSGLVKNSLKVVRKPLALHDERDRMLRRSFAFGMIRSMSGSMARLDKTREQIRAAYEKGLAEGERRNFGTNWKKYYEECRGKLERAHEMIRLLGCSYYDIPGQNAPESVLESWRSGIRDRMRELEAGREVAQRLKFAFNEIDYAVRSLSNVRDSMIKDFGAAAGEARAKGETAADAQFAENLKLAKRCAEEARAEIAEKAAAEPAAEGGVQ